MDQNIIDANLNGIKQLEHTTGLTQSSCITLTFPPSQWCL